MVDRASKAANDEATAGHRRVAGFIAIACGLTALPCLAAASSNAAVEQPAATQPAPPVAQDDDALVRAHLLSPVESVAPGDRVELAIEFEIQRGWHIYYDGLNDTGFAPAANWSLPEGFEVGATRWPTPKRYRSPGDILDHVYEDRAVILVPVRVPGSAQLGSSVTLSADLEWLVCKDICIPEFAELSITLPITERTGSPTPHATRLIAASERFPQPTPPKTFAGAWRDGELSIRVEGAREIAFYPSSRSVPIRDLLRTGRRKGSELRLTIDHDLAESGQDAVVGIVRYWTGATTSASFEVRISPAPAYGADVQRVDR